MNLTEAQFGTLFGQHIAQNKPPHSQNYEYKVTNGGTFNLKSWREKQPHQPRSLKQANNTTGVFHKISDMSRGQKPFDAFFTRDTESLLVIHFNKYKEFFMIPIQDVPDTDAITHDYCKHNFKANKLLSKRDIDIYVL